MYQKILVALDHTAADDALMPHITDLARLMNSELVLVHVATGWVAQWSRHLNLDESQEMREDKAYLQSRADALQEGGFRVSPHLLIGYPHQEILKIARQEGCDLIAMTTHGHRFLYDILIGSTIDKVRHESDIPLLIVRSVT